MTEAAVRDSAGTSFYKYSMLLMKNSVHIFSCMLFVKHWGPVNWLLTNSLSKDETNFLLDNGFPTCFFCGGTPHFIYFLNYLNIYQGVFGMNVSEITPSTNGSLWQYFAVALPLTLVTAYIIVAFRSKYTFLKGSSLMKRLAWPYYLVLRSMFSRKDGPPAENPEYHFP